MPSRSVFLAIAAALLLLAAACGTYRPNRIEFRFTPIPVTAFPDGTPVSFYPDCELFIADQVGVRLDAKDRQTFERWLDGIGFGIWGRDGVLGRDGPLSADADIYGINYIVRVPLGSVPDAITLIEKQRGVRYATRNPLGHFPEDPPLGIKYFGCKPAE